MIPFKAEIFDSDYNLVDYSVIDNPNINYDYLTLESFNLVLPKISNVQRNDYVLISQGKENVFNGIVKGVALSDGITTITIRPLLSIFDVKSYYDRTAIETCCVEQYLKSIMESLYVHTDDVQKINGFKVELKSQTHNESLGVTENINNLWHLCTRALEMFGIIVNCFLNVGEKSINVEISKVVSTPKVVEANLSSIVDVQVNLKDDFGKVNKAIFINKKNEEDDPIIKKSTDYKKPAVFTYEYLDSDDFAGAAESKAQELFSKKKCDNLIEFTTTVDNPLVSCDVGDNTDIIYNNGYFSSVMTGFEISGNVKKYVFGSVRLDLTKMLKLEKRRMINW